MIAHKLGGKPCKSCMSRLVYKWKLDNIVGVDAGLRGMLPCWVDVNIFVLEQPAHGVLYFHQSSSGFSESFAASISLALQIFMPLRKPPRLGEQHLARK